MNDLQLMHEVVRLALAAGEAILPFWRADVAVTNKADDSPVTAADLAAHRVIADGLLALAPQIPVLSEEDSNIPLAERQGWSRWWLVDPLDGTKEFIAGSEEFTVNIALVENGEVVFGVVSMPTKGRCYFGGRGLGAWRAETGETAQPIRFAAHRRRGGVSPWLPAVAIPARNRKRCWPGWGLRWVTLSWPISAVR